MKDIKLPKITFWRVVFIIILLAGGYATIKRFWLGLGASTNLTDTYPWGLWVAFNMYAGVGLSAGGFTVAAVVYIFNLEKYRAVARSSVLLAFLGYMQVGATLIYEIGLPWRIWHPVIFHNPHSVMFEVAWCVMLYLTVLALEFSPVVLERFGLHKLGHILHQVMIPVILFGIILSTLHQSSLGTMFLIVPEKLYPLWYSPKLPIFYFISAVAVGLAMVIFESALTSRAFGRAFDMGVLNGVARALVVVLAVFAVMRINFLYVEGSLQYVFMWRFETFMFALEFGLGAIVPIVILSLRRFRHNANWLFAGSVLAILGFVLHRGNVVMTGMQRYLGGSYFPSWEEIAITLLLIAVPVAVFSVAAKYLPIFPHQNVPAQRRSATSSSRATGPAITGASPA